MRHYELLQELRLQTETFHKRCTQCRETKSSDMFYRSAKNKDGMGSHCKPCSKEVGRAWVAKNKDRNRAKKREWNEANAELNASYKRKWVSANKEKASAATRTSQRKYPEKHRARKSLVQAVYMGKVSKPDQCEDCRGRFPKEKIQGHHKDYTKPFDVEWLCQKCHTIADAKMSATTQGE